MIYRSFRESCSQAFSSAKYLTNVCFFLLPERVELSNFVDCLYRFDFSLQFELEVHFQTKIKRCEVFTVIAVKTVK